MEVLVVYGLLLIMFSFFHFFNGIKVNLSTLFYLIFLIFYGPAFIAYHWGPAITHKQSILSWLMIIVVICFFLANWLTKFYFNQKFDDNYHYNNWVKLPFVSLKDNLFISNVYIAIFFVVIITLLGLFVYGGISSLKEAFSISALVPEYFDYLRAESGAKGWISPFYNYTTSSLGRFIVFLGVTIGIIRKNKIVLILSIVGILLILLSQLSNLMKSSSIFFLIQLHVLYRCIKGKSFNIISIIFQLLLLILLLLVFYLTLTNATSLEQALGFIYHRIFEVPNEVLQMYIDTWPDQKPHTYGLNIRIIHSLFGHGEFESSDAYLCGFPGCTFNAIFIGDAWVDFSYWGVVWESLFLGFYFALMDFLIFRQRNEITIALFPALIIGVLISSSVAMLATMITYGLLSIPLLSLFFFRNKFLRKA